MKRFIILRGSGSLDRRVTKVGESFLEKLVTKSVSLPLISKYFIKTFTADKTTAALAWASLGVILSQMDCASLSSVGL
jgi:hypothetical protein